MMKATLRSAVLLGLLVWSIPSFAEVQNVRVGGDVTVRSFFRDNLDLHDDQDATDDVNFFMQTTGVNIGADLTENVSAFLRLANQRDWNRDGAAAGDAGSFTSDVNVSQAYITLKELFYSPLTVRIGTQPIWFGRGFVIGSTLIPGAALGGLDPDGSIAADEFSDFTSFDAIRGTLDLSGVGGLPLVTDLVFARIDENTPSASDDVTLLGGNVGSKFDAFNSEAEIYYWNKRDKGRAVAGDHENGNVSTLGLRGSVQPVEGAYLFGELAYQFGKRGEDPSGVLVSGDAQQAWASDLGIEYTFANIATTPKLGFEWIFWSGKDADGAVNGWDPMFRGYFTSALREFQGAGLYPTDQAGDTASATNQHQLAWYGSLKPLEDLTVSPRLTLFILDEGAIPVAGAKRERYAGFEWDTQVLYNYTEDVQFGLIYALFAPGSVYRTAVSATSGDATAQELITTVGVKF